MVASINFNKATVTPSTVGACRQIEKMLQLASKLKPLSRFLAAVEIKDWIFDYNKHEGVENKKVSRKY